MVRAQQTLRIPRADLLPLRLREVLWEDRATSESSLDETVGERLDLDAHRQQPSPEFADRFGTPVGTGELAARGRGRIRIVAEIGRS